MIVYDQIRTEDAGSLWLDESRFVTYITEYRRYSNGWLFEAPDSVPLLYSSTSRDAAVRLYLKMVMPHKEVKVVELPKREEAVEARSAAPRGVVMGSAASVAAANAAAGKAGMGGAATSATGS